jgi:hypothetical protein
VRDVAEKEKWSAMWKQWEFIAGVRALDEQWNDWIEE